MNPAVRHLVLTTDFGLQDGYTGSLKGRIAAVSPHIQIIDNTHMVPAQDVLAGAVNLLVCATGWAAETAHLVVVDPEVGSIRKGLIVRAWDQWFVGPDSGVLHFPIKAAMAAGNNDIYSILSSPEENGSTTFAGRDWFAPVAAQLAAGTPVSDLAELADDAATLNIPEAVFDDYRWEGRVIHIDTYGNLISNLPAPSEEAQATARVFVGDHPIGPIRSSYADVDKNKPVATIGSLATTEISLNQGHAQKHFRVRRGEKVEILFPDKTPEPVTPAWHSLLEKNILEKPAPHHD